MDLGSGSGEIYRNLIGKGYEVVPMDVEDLSYTKEAEPVIYDSEQIPCEDNAFDVVLILTVLHHASNPEKVLKEAKRVSAEKIIVIEDIYSNWFHKYLTYFFDSLLNLEFKGHPHKNKSDEEWRKIFKDLDLELVEVKYEWSFIFLKHANYFLKKK